MCIQNPIVILLVCCSFSIGNKFYFFETNWTILSLGMGPNISPCRPLGKSLLTPACLCVPIPLQFSMCLRSVDCLCDRPSPSLMCPWSRPPSWGDIGVCCLCPTTRLDRRIETAEDKPPSKEGGFCSIGSEDRTAGATCLIS